MKTKLLILILITGLIAACGSQPTEAPASPPTDEPAPVTEAPASTDTVVPPTDEPAPTEEPTTPPTAEGTTVSFVNEVLPLLQSRCLNCHGGDRVEEGLSVKGYAELMAGSENGAVVIPSNADGSLLVELVSTGKMPKRGPKLTPPQTQLIIDWINQGALDN